MLEPHHPWPLLPCAHSPWSLDPCGRPSYASYDRQLVSTVWLEPPTGKSVLSWPDDRALVWAEYDRASVHKAVRALNAATAAVEEKQALSDAQTRTSQAAIAEIEARQARARPTLCATRDDDA
jgi:hypothetical protein